MDKKLDGENKEKYTPILMLLISFSLYCLSLLLPAIKISENIYAQGFDVLQTGVLGVLILQFGWFANPIYLISVFSFLLKKYNESLIISISSSLIAAQSLSLLDGGGSGEYTIDGLAVGFIPWVGSFLFIAFSSFYLAKNKKP